MQSGLTAVALDPTRPAHRVGAARPQQIIAGFGGFAMVLAWLVPNHYPPWLSAYNELAMAAAIALLALSLGREWAVSRVSVVAPVVLVVSLIPLLQYAFGQLVFRDDAWVSWVYVAGFGVAVGVGEMAAQRDARGAGALIAFSVLIASLVSSGLAIFQGLELSGLGVYSLEAYSGMRAYANFAQPNHLATFLGLGVLAVMLLYEQRHLEKASAVFMLGFLLIGAALTQSKTCLLYGPAIAVAWYLTTRRGVAYRTGLPAILAVTVAHWALTLLWPTIQDQLLLASDSSIAARSADAGRLEAWRFFLDAAAQAPWVGFGWLQTAAGQYAVALQHPTLFEQVWFQSHNLFLDLVLWCGYPLGLLVSVAILAWALDRARRVATAEATVAWLCVVIVGVHAMLEYPLHYAYFLMPVGLWVGQVEAGVRAVPRLRAAWLLAPALLVAALVIEAGREYPAVEEDFRRVRFENLRLGPPLPAEATVQAPMLPSLTAYMRLMRTPVGARVDEGALMQFEQVTRRYPFSGALYRCAMALAFSGHPERAREMLLRFRRIHGEASYRRVLEQMQQRVQDGDQVLRPVVQSRPR